MTSAHSYFFASSAGGESTGNAEVPPEVLEIMLMERFNWTPMEIDQIPVRKLRTMLAILNQRRVSSAAAEEIKQRTELERAKNAKRGRGKGR